MDLCPKIITTSSANEFSLKPTSYSTTRHSTGASYCLGNQYACQVFDLNHYLTSSDKPAVLTEVTGKQRDVTTQSSLTLFFPTLLSLSLLH